MDITKMTGASNLPAMEVEVDAAVNQGNYRFLFDKNDINTIIVKGNDQERRYKLSDITLRMLSCFKTYTEYDGQKYIRSDDHNEDAKTHMTVMQLATRDGYCFGTLMMRRSLNMLAAFLNEKIKEMSEQLKAAGKENLIPQIFLFLPFRPVFRRISTQGGSYLKVESLQYDQPQEAEVKLAINAFTELEPEYEAAKKAADWWR